MIYLVVEGWIHPIGGGDNIHFVRGFIVPRHKTIEEFKEWFITHKMKGCAVKDDFDVLEVSKSKWEESFHLNPN